MFLTIWRTVCVNLQFQNLHSTPSLESSCKMKLINHIWVLVWFRDFVIPVTCKIDLFRHSIISASTSIVNPLDIRNWNSLYDFIQPPAISLLKN